ncbi:Nucleolar protein [Scheffersomyces stipitis CBS 6054]|uniref:Pescadillo homolog n=1 Tax=Scheffersomyces stipitis (strain ATCC 58785 / CBS 6054 / NBRC 10063 / NRRL Y-11545) TaxID=322104 RepID=PESC_PICST|nr:Nucleolar protein [Scheffersomyces stipitis CBS 6054]A3LU56.2 RecName: Full=Pescadillo homolog; AltName: Full=Nucleolar protein 7 homolog [Scheffersomyces stipitis CBS 6054]ABN66528.2 Nucleolar protein [Scheffersomyces stipitis CBS 6054]
MAKIKKRGVSGNAKNFITRTQAVKKLQVSLSDFRRLCIFKGIYPREPRNKKKANKGSTAPVTFYYAKDIQYLSHEPVLAKFREHKTFAKKLQRALGRGEVSDAQKLEANRPKYTLEHIIKERYPTFLDALRDIDDPLNMLFLFANMPATDKVSHRVTKEAEKLTNQWLAYVAKERLIKKVFVSIKGVYYQANVKGQEIRWLVPFKFPTNIPTDVDFRIMLTFLEFYSTLLHFVLYRLYNDSNLIYPPTIDIEKLKGIGGLSSYVLQSKDQGVSALLPQDKKIVEDDVSVQGKELSTANISKALEADNEGEEHEEVEQETVENVELDKFEASATKTAVDSLVQPSKYASPTSTLFSKFIFYVGREVPLDILELCILSCGGSVVSEVALDDLKTNSPDAYKKLDLSNITHQIIDRPKILQKVAGRTYIQPQWIFDCINKSELLPVNKYAPGETLPPHLSPWGDAGSYNPEAEKVDQSENAEEEEEDEVDEDDEDADEDEEDEEEEDEEEDEDLKAQKELELEAAGVKFSEIAEKEKKAAKKASKKRPAEEDEEKELKKIMMTNKQRKLYKKMQYGIDKKETRTQELAKKKRKIEKTKAQLDKLSKK